MNTATLYSISTEISSISNILLALSYQLDNDGDTLNERALRVLRLYMGKICISP